MLMRCQCDAWQIVFWWLVFSYTRSGWRTLRARGIVETVRSVYLAIVQKGYDILLRTPQGRRKLAEQLASSRVELKQKLIDDKEKAVATLQKHTSLPEHGRSRQDIVSYFDELEKISKSDWQNGRVR